ncbi:phosphotransferase enzyme family protein [Paenibacillus nasutitermitis]|uniref:Aminoglycoside phosphotransferase domain-containing protein n=1 Tax=Paenibacillus nasutitermitis TaxID=1652958 RepID=A0A917DXG5_9BACL|nr:phosphotransferase [Paenibacillus nasutitermitis]GGD76893.1 hypothetical protein GCM10010911_38750 [Paenibacillus nasutitermitis]
MKTKLQTDESALITKLNEEYGIQADKLLFIPMGDSAYSYLLNGTAAQRYYLKVFDHHNDSQRKGIARLDGYLPATWHLYHQGLFRNLASPIRTRAGEYKIVLSDCTAVLFPFIEGESLAEAYPFSIEILQTIGKLAALLHQSTSRIAAQSLVIETYSLDFVPGLEKALSALEQIQSADDPNLQSLREHVLPRKKQIAAMLELVQKLGRAAAADPGEKVLCHGDLWGGNLIRHETGICVIDWESLIMAPPELDFMSYIGDGFEVFFSAYEKQIGHPVTINIDMLRFYAYRHHLRNLTNWLMNILYRNLDNTQRANDLEMILHHCINRWDHIEPNMQAVEAGLPNRK